MGKKKSSNVENYVLTFPLVTEKWQEDIIDKRFKLLKIIYNDFQSKMIRKYIYMSQLDTFKKCKTPIEISEFIDQYSVDFKTSNGTIRKIHPFTEYGFISYMSKFGKHYSDFGINSTILAYIASSCWKAWQSFLFHGGKIKFKKNINIYKIRDKGDGFPGINNKELLNNNKLVINVNGKRGKNAKFITIPFKVNKKYPYELYCFMDKIVNLAIKREIIRGKKRYFVQFTFEGKKYSKNRKLGKGNVGIDLGISIVTAASDSIVSINELGNQKIDDIEREIRKTKNKLARSIRHNNPSNFYANGTVKPHKNKLFWRYSNHYRDNYAKLNELYRKQRILRKKHHIGLANNFLHFGKHFVVENNRVNQWLKTIKYKTKKPLASKAPAMFISILKNKVVSLGGTFDVVQCVNAASQFDFTNQTFTKHKLWERKIKLSNGDIHLRDTIAAFNLQHLLYDGCQKSCNNYDINGMIQDYSNFCELEKKEIKRQKNISSNVAHTIGID